MKTVTVAGAIIGLGLAGCSTVAQDAPAVVADAGKYAAMIAAECARLTPLVTSPVADLVVLGLPQAQIARDGFNGVCTLAGGVEKAATSATTLQWLGTVETIFRTNGRVLPPPVQAVAVAR